MAGKVRLDISIADTPQTRRLLTGEVGIEGVEPNFIEVKPQIAAYRHMVRDHAYDVCELAPTTYIVARAYGAPFRGLPIFVTRGFHHGGTLVRSDAGVSEPKDLEGKAVGVRAYSVTAAVWKRAVLTEEFGLDADKVTWVVDDEEHVREMQLPPNVLQARPGRSLYQMMMDGELAAGLAGNAGVGRTGSPDGGWQTVKTDWPDLIPDAAALEAEWFARTGIYPMHGTIVVKDAVLEAHPGVARALYDAFEQAKLAWLDDLRAGRAVAGSDRKLADLARIVGDDPLPYGIEANLPSILALERAAHTQRLSPRRMALDEIFVDPLAI